MLKLNKNYYIAIDSDNQLVGRFTNIDDAYQVLPQLVPCFGRTLRDGRVYLVDEDFPDLFNPSKMVIVFESVEEFNCFKKIDDLNL